jgi:hypothetical protein
MLRAEGGRVSHDSQANYCLSTPVRQLCMKALQFLFHPACQWCFLNSYSHANYYPTIKFYSTTWRICCGPTFLCSSWKDDKGKQFTVLRHASHLNPPPLPTSMQVYSCIYIPHSGIFKFMYKYLFLSAILDCLPPRAHNSPRECSVSAGAVLCSVLQTKRKSFPTTNAR